MINQNNKTPEEIVRPYIIAVIITIIVTTITVLIIKHFDTPSKPIDLGVPIPNQPVIKAPIQTEPAIKPEKSIPNNELYAKEIEIALNEADTYLNRTYNPADNERILKRLNLLFKIQDLSDLQNIQLSSRKEQLKALKKLHEQKSKVNKNTGGGTNPLNLEESDTKFHIVKEGEGFFGIAKQYRLTEAQLRELNPSLTKESILQPGQKIKIKY